MLSHTLQQAIPQFAALWPERFIYGDALDDGFSVMHRLRMFLFRLFIKTLFLLHEINIGNNLNQIAAFFNSGGIQSRAMLEEINRCMTDLRAMRKEIAGLAGDYRGNLKTRRG